MECGLMLVPLGWIGMDSLWPFAPSSPIPHLLGKEENQNIPWALWGGVHNRKPLSDQLRGPE